MAVERRGCASERRRACNVPVAKPIVVEGGDACQREVESVQRTCSWTDSGRVCNRGRGDQKQSARRNRVTDDSDEPTELLQGVLVQTRTMSGSGDNERGAGTTSGERRKWRGT